MKKSIEKSIARSSKEIGSNVLLRWVTYCFFWRGSDTIDSITVLER